MRRLLVLALALASASASACTSEDPAPLFVDTEYQVRCVRCTPQAVDDPAREISAIDGENGFNVECNVDERGGDKVVSFVATYTDERESRSYSIQVIQANLEGSDPGSSCRVVVREGANTYEGQCTADDPTAEEPCSVSLEAEGGIVTGTILCQEIQNRNAATVTRHLVAPGSEDPAEFEVHGCVGL